MLHKVRRFWSDNMLAIGLLFALFCGFTMASPASAFVLNADTVRSWFDAQFVLIALAAGFVWKYVPALASWNNELINWLQLVAYMLLKLKENVLTGTNLGLAESLVGTAHAGVLGSVGEAAKVAGLSFTDHLFLGIAHTRITRELYEFLARPFLERVLGWKKPPVAKAA